MPVALALCTVRAVLRLRRLRLVAVLALLLSSAAMAEVRLPAVFGDHMVFQRGRPMAVFGRARPAEQVTVVLRNEARDAIRSGSVTAGPDGRFRVEMAPMAAAAEPMVLQVSAGNTVTITDVVVGEVWIAGGQSNMEMELGATGTQRDDGRRVADDPSVRFMRAPHVTAPCRAETIDAAWKVLTPSSASSLSAIAFWMAVDLRRALGVPVGILSISWGGTEIEPWTDLDTLSAHAPLAERLARQHEAVAAWMRSAPQGAVAAASRVPGAVPGTAFSDPAAMFHGMIAPFAGFSVAGVIWYQGESNAMTQARADEYRALLPLLVRSWRTAFGRDDLPFGVVSLAAFRPFTPETPCSGFWPALRASQLEAERGMRGVGVVTTIDVGDAADIHPRDKRTVGQRLARWALARVYGRLRTPWRGPRVASVRRAGSNVEIDFDVEGGRLGTRGGGPVGGVSLMDASGTSVWTQAEVCGPATLRVLVPSGAAPILVRYAWQDNPANANLIDVTQGLPAHPFEVQVPR